MDTLSNETILALKNIAETINTPRCYDWWMLGITFFGAGASSAIAYMVYRVVKNQAKMQKQEQVKDIYIHAAKMLDFIKKVDSNIIRCCSVDDGFKILDDEYSKIHSSSYTLYLACALLNNKVYQELYDLSLSFDMSSFIFKSLETKTDRPVITKEEITDRIKNKNYDFRGFVHDKFSGDAKFIQMLNQMEETQKKYDGLLKKIIN